MNPEQLLARLKSLRESFSTRQLVTMGVTFLVIVLGMVVLTRWLNTPTYRLLFSDLDAEAAAQVVERLKEQKVPFELADGGHGIRVPEERIDALRLEFAGHGMPMGGRIGFELFEGTNFGWTEFLEQVNYRRALEGELARTISTIDEVVSARVHIAMGQKALFARDRTPAKASVTLKLRGRKPVSADTVAGIRNLVAYAIDDLQPESVVVMDDRGRPLAVGGDELDPSGPRQLEAKAAHEEQVARAIGAMLDPLVGAEHYRVSVSATLNHDSQDVVAELYGKDGVVRSEERIVEASGAAAGTIGVAGARANVPAPALPGENVPGAASIAPPPATSGTTGGTQRTHEKSNYEIDRTTTRTVRPPGGVARLSVALLVDHAMEMTTGADGQVVRTAKPRDPAFMQQLSDLASKAAGLDTARGDVLTVQNIAFELPPDVADQPAPTFLQRVSPTAVVGGVLAVALLVGGAFTLLRMARGGKRAPAAAEVAAQVLPQQQLPRTIEEIEGEIEAELDAAATRASDRKMPVLTKRVSGLVQAEPEAAARLVRSWLLEEKKA